MMYRSSITKSVKGRIRRKNPRIFHGEEDVTNSSPTHSSPSITSESQQHPLTKYQGNLAHPPRHGLKRVPPPSDGVLIGRSLQDQKKALLRRSVGRLNHRKIPSKGKAYIFKHHRDGLTTRSRTKNKRGPYRPLAKYKPLHRTRKPSDAEREQVEVKASPTKPISASDMPLIKLGDNLVEHKPKLDVSPSVSESSIIADRGRRIITPPARYRGLLYNHRISPQAKKSLFPHSEVDEDDSDGDESDDEGGEGFVSDVNYSGSSVEHLPARQVYIQPMVRTVSHRSPRKKNDRYQSDTLNINKRTVAEIAGRKLRNLLKLPKAHRWVCYEWFYSNLDEAILCGENDFQACLDSSFNALKTRKLLRPEWGLVRRLLGKPRRCSNAFFQEEMRLLEQKRSKVRFLQQRKGQTAPDLKDLPSIIPLPLVLASKVTARLRRPQDGLFTGKVLAVDTVTNTYRVLFDRTGLGTYSIPDIEVRAKEPPNTIPLSSFVAKPSRTPHTTARGGLDVAPTEVCNQLLTMRSHLLYGDDSGNYGAYPISYLKVIARLSKALYVKREWTSRLKSMNNEIERRRSFGESVTFESKRRYAYVVVGMEKLNQDLDEYFNNLQGFTRGLLASLGGRENVSGGVESCDPQEMRVTAEEEAKEMVKVYTGQVASAEKMRDGELKNLIIKLTGMLLQVERFNAHRAEAAAAFDLTSLVEAMDECKAKLDVGNLGLFQRCVEPQLNLLQSSLTQLTPAHNLLLQTSHAHAHGGYTKVIAPKPDNTTS